MNVTETVRPDGTKHIVVSPDPATYSLRALMGSGQDLATAVRTMLASGARITLTPDARRMLGKECPEALRLIEGRDHHG